MVQLPEDVPFSSHLTGDPSFTISSPDDAFGGFVLDPVDPLKSELAAFRFPSEMHDGDGDYRAYGSWNFLNPPGDPYDVIPAGTYRLHVFSEDNQPVDIELRLDGLDGRVDLAPTTTASTKVVRLNPTLPTPDEGIHQQSWYEFQASDQGGIVIAVAAWQGDVHAERLNYCLYEAGMTGVMGDTALYSPLCHTYPLGSNGSTGGFFGASNAFDGTTAQWWTAGRMHHPEYAVSFSSTSVGTDAVTAIAAFVAFDTPQ